MDNHSYPIAANVIPLQAKLKGKDAVPETRPVDVKPGSKDDPRMKEALALMQAFLAIEDQVARGALVKLAEQLVSHDWARRAKHR